MKRYQVIVICLAVGFVLGKVTPDINMPTMLPVAAAKPTVIKSPPPAPKPAPQAVEVDEPAVEMVKGWGWRTKSDLFLELVNVKVKNNTSTDIKDVEIYCVAFAESGTRIDSNSRTQFKVIKAGETLNLGTIDMGFLHSQVDKQNCSIKTHSKA
jgi:hypothetical protein